MAKKSDKDGKDDHKGTIALNKRARHEYHFDERLEAGLALQGWEVKSLRAGRVNITDGYAIIKNGEVFLFGAQIMAFIYGDFFAEGATVLAILSASRLYAVFTGNSGALLMMTGHQKTMMRITMLSAAFGLTTELLLVRPFGMVGVAVATALAQVLQNTLQLVFGKLRTGIWSQAELSLRPIKAMLGR